MVISLFQNRNIRFDIALNTEHELDLVVENEYGLIITDMGRGSQPDAGLQFIRRINQLGMQNAPPIAVFASYVAIGKYGHEAKKLGAIAALNEFADIISLIGQIFDMNVNMYNTSGLSDLI